MNALSLNTTTRSFLLRQKASIPSDSFFTQLAVCCIHIRSGSAGKPLGQLDSSEAMKREKLMIETILVVLLILFLIGALH